MASLLNFTNKDSLRTDANNTALSLSFVIVLLFDIRQSFLWIALARPVLFAPWIEPMFTQDKPGVTYIRLQSRAMSCTQRLMVLSAGNIHQIGPCLFQYDWPSNYIHNNFILKQDLILCTFCSTSS